MGTNGLAHSHFIASRPDARVCVYCMCAQSNIFIYRCNMREGRPIGDSVSSAAERIAFFLRLLACVYSVMTARRARESERGGGNRITAVVVFEFPIIIPRVEFSSA